MNKHTDADIINFQYLNHLLCNIYRFVLMHIKKYNKPLHKGNALCNVVAEWNTRKLLKACCSESPRTKKKEVREN